MKSGKQLYDEYVKAQFVEPGPTADRIAELEREIARWSAAEWSETKADHIHYLQRERDRLRSEQPKGGDAILPGETFGSSKPNQPLTQGPGSECDRSGAAPSPGPQDVRTRIADIARDNYYDHAPLVDTRTIWEHIADGVLSAFPAIAQSDAPPWLCPIGIAPDNHNICSAGSCYWCLADRVKGGAR